MSDERGNTIREAIAAALANRALTAREVSQEVGIREREVSAHLAHLERSLPNRGQALRMLPARCVACAYVFKKRERFERPSRCPVCRSERIQPPRFAIEPG